MPACDSAFVGAEIRARRSRTFAAASVLSESELLTIIAEWAALRGDGDAMTSCIARASSPGTIGLES